MSWKILHKYSTELIFLRKQGEKKQEMQGTAYTAICTRMNLKYCGIKPVWIRIVEQQNVSNILKVI